MGILKWTLQSSLKRDCLSLYLKGVYICVYTSTGLCCGFVMTATFCPQSSSSDLSLCLLMHKPLLTLQTLPFLTSCPQCVPICPSHLTFTCLHTCPPFTLLATQDIHIYIYIYILYLSSKGLVTPAEFIFVSWENKRCWKHCGVGTTCWAAWWTELDVQTFPAV